MKSFPNRCCLLLEQLNNQRSNKIFCDVVVCVEETEYQAHRCVLAASSVKLHSMLVSFCENKEDGNILTIEHITAKGFKVLLDFIYTGKLRFESSILQDVLQAAVFLGLSDAESACLKSIKTEDNSDGGTMTSIKSVMPDLAPISGVGQMDFNNLPLMTSPESGILNTLNSMDKCSKRVEQSNSGIEAWPLESKLFEMKGSGKQPMPNLIRIGEQPHTHRKATKSRISKKQKKGKDFQSSGIVNGGIKDPIYVPEDNGPDSKGSSKHVRKNGKDCHKLQVDKILDGKMLKVSVIDLKDMFVKRKKTLKKAKVDYLSDVSTEDYVSDGDDGDGDVSTNKDEFMESASSDPKVKEECADPNFAGQNIDDKQLKIIEEVEISDQGLKSCLEQIGIEPKENKNSSEQFACAVCNRRFCRQCDLTRHKRSHFRHTFQCRHCKAEFADPIEFKRHNKSLHNDINAFDCPFPDCKFRSDCLSGIEHHSVIHSNHKQHTCPYCGQSFHQQQGLNSHLRSCTQQLPYLCDLCGAKFNHMQSMQSHRRVHTGEKPYQCTHCGSRFADQRNLKRHRRIHENAFPYQCPLCFKRFRHSNSLKSHLVMHNSLYDKTAEDATIRNSVYERTTEDAVNRNSLFERTTEDAANRNSLFERTNEDGVMRSSLFERTPTDAVMHNSLFSKTPEDAMACNSLIQKMAAEAVAGINYRQFENNTETRVTPNSPFQKPTETTGLRQIDPEN